MTTDVEQLIIARLDHIEAKVDAMSQQLAESRGAHKLLSAVSAVGGGLVGALIGRWSWGK